MRDCTRWQHLRAIPQLQQVSRLAAGELNRLLQHAVHIQALIGDPFTLPLSPCAPLAHPWAQIAQFAIA